MKNTNQSSLPLKSHFRAVKRTGDKLKYYLSPFNPLIPQIKTVLMKVDQ